MRLSSDAQTVRSLADLKPGLALSGIVRNVTQFGAFVDLVVGRDGLLHTSELGTRQVCCQTSLKTSLTLSLCVWVSFAFLY